MSKFESFPLQNVGKNGVKFGDEEDNQSKEEELKEKFKPLTDYLQDVLSEQCEEVVVSTVFLIVSYYFTAFNIKRLCCNPHQNRSFSRI